MTIIKQCRTCFNVVDKKKRVCPICQGKEFQKVQSSSVEKWRLKKLMEGKVKW